MQRKTTQRSAICQAFQRAERPLSPAEVLEEARQHTPRLGIATVYRAVRQLTHEGWLQPVELPGEPVRWELADKPHHHHFYCRECGKVYDLPGCPGNLAAMVPRGFKIENHEITIRGLCPNC